ncbi:hypothetical protein GCM10010405_37730 [Streptomyces macrosporus]|uniref:Uncharacterized protein n=1 Tax=Streptomyces macrosporus TaxID=44032 RepID=A0ABP5XAP4_9ACTN
MECPAYVRISHGRSLFPRSLASGRSDPVPTGFVARSLVPRSLLLTPFGTGAPFGSLTSEGVAGPGRPGAAPFGSLTSRGWVMADLRRSGSG